jgi:dihydrofolate reductase
VAEADEADPRDRAFSQWLNKVEKVVFSTTLTEAAWQNTTLTSRSPAEVVADLRERPGGDIVVVSSSSVIRDLLNADAIDRLSITLCPETVGGGARLFDDDVLASGAWSLADHTVTASGALCLLYDRTR